MSQRNVERVIGLLATDEGLRLRFTRNPHAALQELVSCGMELTSSEMGSLAHVDPRELARFADAVGPRLQRTDLAGGAV
jgi:hypothetical protein